MIGRKRRLGRGRQQVCLKQRNNASFFLIAAIKQHKRFISICLAGESPSASASASATTSVAERRATSLELVVVSGQQGAGSG